MMFLEVLISKPGKTGVIISRPINKLYPLEVRANDVPMVENNIKKRVRRETAIVGELRTKFNDLYDCSSQRGEC